MKHYILLVIIFLIILIPNYEYLAYGHGWQCMASGGNLRIDDEVFSSTNVSIGDTILIQGQLVNPTNDEQQTRLWVGSDYVNNSYFLDDITRIFSGSPEGCFLLGFNGNPEWYFNIVSNPSGFFTLEPSEKIPFTINLTALKGGQYHIHSAILYEDSFRAGVGQTISVEGSNWITDGEIFGFYLPFLSSIVVIIFVLVIGIMLFKRRVNLSKTS